MILFKRLWHYFVFVTFGWGIPMATIYLLLSKESSFNFLEISKQYFRAICYGFLISVFIAPLYIINMKSKKQRIYTETNHHFEKIDMKLKKILLSNYFFILVFCFIVTIKFVGMIVADKDLSIPNVVISYISAILLGFSFLRFLLMGKYIWDKADKFAKKLETEQYISTMTWILTWLYFVCFIGCIVIGFGMGTFGWVFVRFVGQLSFDIVSLTINTYKRCLIVGFFVRNIQFIILIYKRVKYKKIIKK